MFKKIGESVQNAMVFQKSLDIKMKRRDIDALSARKFFNQKEGII
ncbi:MAG: hypothetical protein AAB966_01300 [Patescibacteria group bacterium]